LEHVLAAKSLELPNQTLRALDPNGERPYIAADGKNRVRQAVCVRRLITYQA
jgi:hypothetical protein